MNAHSSQTNSSLHLPSVSFIQHLEASHQTMRKPSPTSNSHLQMAIRTHGASFAGSAPFPNFHSVSSGQTPKPFIGGGTATRSCMMSSLGPKAKSAKPVGTSVFGGKADSLCSLRNFPTLTLTGPFTVVAPGERSSTGTSVGGHELPDELASISKLRLKLLP